MALSKLDSTALGTLSGNLSFANGQGIDFSATSDGSGTASSEVFTDYERGTCTLTLNGGTTNPNTTISATGYYEKIGRICTVTYNFEDVDTTGASGNVAIYGLPFACNHQSDGTYQVASGGFSHYSAMTSAFTNTSVITGSSHLIVDNSSYFNFLQSRNNSSWNTLTHNAGTSRYIRGTIAYTTD